MLPRVPVLLSTLFCLVVPGPAAGALQEYSRLSSARGLVELRARDARLSFTRATAERARAVLMNPPPAVAERALAVAALGASGSTADLPRIESLASDGQPEERRAALLALGDLREKGLPALERALRRDASGFELELLLALVHALGRGTPACQERFTRLTEQGGALAPAAQALLAWARGDEVGEPLATLERYYGLRWSAARQHGFVDGKRWQRCLLEDLCADEEFLDRVVLAAAVDLDPDSVRDHLHEILLGGERPGALRAAASLMPGELVRAIEAGEWRPRSDDDWLVLLDEIDRRRSERAARALLELAFKERGPAEVPAGLLLLRAGAELPWRWVGDQIVAGTPELRARLVEACGDRGDKERVADLVDLLEKRPDLGVYGEGLVALARLGHEPARAAIENELAAAPSAQRSSVVRALARVLHDRRVQPLAEKALRAAQLDPGLRFELELGFALNGGFREREKLRAALAEIRTHPRRLEVVRALSTGAESEDLAALRALFPVEGDLDLNVELALALVRQREPAATAILRAALWNPAWNRSVIAGGLIARASGLEALVDELASPSPRASEADIRRVGFAIGEWGGLEALEALARTRKESDPALQGALLGALSTRSR